MHDKNIWTELLIINGWMNKHFWKIKLSKIVLEKTKGTVTYETG